MLILFNRLKIFIKLFQSPFRGGWSRKMRQGRFPPFGFETLEFGFREPFKTPVFAFFDFQKNEIRVQKDAPWSISPHPGSDFGSWAPGGLLNPRFRRFFFFRKIRFFAGKDRPNEIIFGTKISQLRFLES